MSHYQSNKALKINTLTLPLFMKICCLCSFLLVTLPSLTQLMASTGRQVDYHGADIQPDRDRINGFLTLMNEAVPPTQVHSSSQSVSRPPQYPPAPRPVPNTPGSGALPANSESTFTLPIEIILIQTGNTAAHPAFTNNSKPKSRRRLFCF